MRRILLLVCVICPAYSANAQAQRVVEPNQATAAPPESRYEIIQSSIAARVTVRLDRFTGQASVLQSRRDSTTGWDDIPRLPTTEADARVPCRANYQIFTSGLALRFTFLINVNTGATWQLTEDSKTGLYWDPLK